MTLAELGDDARSAIIMEALPALVAESGNLEVARLIRVAARDMPPERDTPVGVARRALLTRVIVRLLAPGPLAAGAGPLSDEAGHIPSALAEAAALPPGG